MNKYYLDKQFIKFLKVITTIMLVCIILVLKYLLYNKLVKYNLTEKSINIVCASLITLYGVWLLIILPMWQRSVCYTLSKTELHISSGVIVRKNIRVRLADVQAVEVVRVPAFTAKSLNIMLIDVSGKRVSLKFLTKNNMEEIYRKINFQQMNKEGQC